MNYVLTVHKIIIIKAGTQNIETHERAHISYNMMELKSLLIKKRKTNMYLHSANKTDPGNFNMPALYLYIFVDSLHHFQLYSF